MVKGTRDSPMLNASLLIAPLAAFFCGMLLCRVVRRVALGVRFVDNPDERRKLHEAPIALGGGLAIWVATWAAWSLAISGLLVPSPRTGSSGYFPVALPIATLVLLVVGLIDDRYGLRGRHKLAWQLVAVFTMASFGLRIHVLSGFGVDVRLGILSFPVTAAWLLIVVNAYNLIDGMDGFCGSLAMIAALAIAFLAWSGGRIEVAVLALALAGALGAFLLDNLPPAKIYLGDAGSLTVGMMIGALSIGACSHGPGTSVALPPLVALLTLPLLDVACALLRRWLTGRSLFTPDRGHIHHCLKERLRSTHTALGAGVGLAVVGAAGALLSRTAGLGDPVSALAVLVTIGLLVGTKTFGRSELRLFWFRIKASIAPIWAAARRSAVRHECHLQGIRDWAAVWDDLLRAADPESIQRIELTIDMTAAGEAFLGQWSSSEAPDEETSWLLVHTLHSRGIPMGTLRLAGNAEGGHSHYLNHVQDLVQMAEGHLQAAVATASPAAVASVVIPTGATLPVTAPLT
jgi:UDP-GlcNAc:undecaprenyl-phosphate GlcNAc-1-phosphate transferase